MIEELEIIGEVAYADDIPWITIVEEPSGTKPHLILPAGYVNYIDEIAFDRIRRTPYKTTAITMCYRQPGDDWAADYIATTSGILHWEDVGLVPAVTKHGPGIVGILYNPAGEGHGISRGFFDVISEAPDEV